MWEYVLIGGGFAFAAAIQPGPLQAFLFMSVSQRGWRRTLPAAFSPLLSDGPVALVVLVLLNQAPEILGGYLRVAGGLFLMYLGWASFRQWKNPSPETASHKTSTPQTLFRAAMVNILNPNPYIGWSLVLGPAALSAWKLGAWYAVALIVSFYLTMVVALAGTIYLFGATQWLAPRRRRTLVLLSSCILALLGAYQSVMGIVEIAHHNYYWGITSLARFSWLS
jgi:threonine/homoserine/homoserine lactone efflux protein